MAIKLSQGFKKYFFNTSWLFFEQVFKMSISLFVIVALSRYLGPEKFGLLSYSQSFIGVFVAFATLGIDVVLVRELTKNKQANDSIIGTAIVIKLLASTIAMIFVFCINLIIVDETARLLTNIIAFTIMFQSINTFDVYFQANVISKYSTFVKLIMTVISSIIKLGLIFFGAKLVYFAYALVFDSIILAFGYIYIYVKQKKSLMALKFNKDFAISFIKNGWPLMIVSVAAFIYTRTDQIMIKYFVGNEAVGNFAAAIKVSELFYFVPLLITQSIFPKLVEIREVSQQQYFIFLENVYKILVWSAIIIALALFFFRNLIVNILYGNQYTEASGVLAILAFAIIFNSIGTVTTKVLYVEHYERKYLYRSILGVFINIGLNFYFIPNYGAQGAAIATLITFFIIYYIYDILDKDLHKFYYLKLKCFIPLPPQRKLNKKIVKKIVKNMMPRLYSKIVEIKRSKIIEKFKKKYPNTKIFSPILRGDRKLYSQDNQDYIVYKNFFKNEKDGFFCDIGGNHPLKINNTLYFEELGWSGIAFEPLPYMEKLWVEYRKAKLFPFALSDSDGEVSFTVVKDATGWEDMLSFVKETRDVDYHYKTEEIQVQTKVFKEIMAQENITHIDYLSLDVEGHELNVLKGIDFDAVKINVLTIENNPPNCSIYGDENIRKIMFENHFILWGRIIELDDIYVHEDFFRDFNR